MLARNNNSNNNNNNNTNYKGQTDRTGYKDKKPDAIGVRIVNADDPDDGTIPAKTDVKSPEDGITIWNDGYYYCLRQQADDVDQHTGTCYNCQEPGHYWRDCPCPLRQALQKAKDCDGSNEQRLNASGDSGAKGARSPESGSEPIADSGSSSKISKPTKASYWNDDPHAHWLGPANLAYVHLDGIRMQVLLDDGSQINSITPAYGQCSHFVNFSHAIL